MSAEAPPSGSSTSRSRRIGEIARACSSVCPLEAVEEPPTSRCELRAAAATGLRRAAARGSPAPAATPRRRSSSRPSRGRRPPGRACACGRCPRTSPAAPRARCARALVARVGLELDPHAAELVEREPEHQQLRLDVRSRPPGARMQPRPADLEPVVRGAYVEVGRAPDRLAPVGAAGDEAPLLTRRGSPRGARRTRRRTRRRSPGPRGSSTPRPRAPSRSPRGRSGRPRRSARGGRSNLRAAVRAGGHITRGTPRRRPAT